MVGIQPVAPQSLEASLEEQATPAQSAEDNDRIDRLADRQVSKERTALRAWYTQDCSSSR